MCYKWVWCVGVVNSSGDTVQGLCPGRVGLQHVKKGAADDAGRP